MSETESVVVAFRIDGGVITSVAYHPGGAAMKRSRDIKRAQAMVANAPVGDTASPKRQTED